MKIGLVTYNNYNFGSALQCYATQRFISQTGNECVLVEKEESRIHAVADKMRNILVNSFISPGSIKQIKKQIKAQSAKSLTLNGKSLKELSRFKKCRIRTEKYTNRELIKAAHSEKFDYFFSGSDQVWNGVRIDRYDMFFLRFAPKEKRIAWAPSFGGEEIAKYNRSRYRKYIGDFSVLSVRENSGKGRIEELTNREAEVLCDPVMLLTDDEWRKEYRNHTSVPLPGKYVLTFFIDEPSEKALSYLRKNCPDGAEIISFGYDYSKYGNLPSHRHVDGSPYDFLNSVDHASFVVTDSYHASVFSVLFHTEFAVFARNYTHAQNQSVRIADFLKEIGEEERFETDIRRGTPDNVKAGLYFERMRIKAREYLKPLIGEIGKKESSDRLFLFGADCCGCGACAGICPKNAISMKEKGDGIYPVLDESLCIGCGKCENVCGLKNLSPEEKEKPKFYIGYGPEPKRNEKSASGGVFASLAGTVLQKGGVVYGAALDLTDGKTDCRHVRIAREEDLHRIQNSKYVQSHTDGIFKDVKADLLNGKTVLFSGTSCQVSSLKKYLKGISAGELITVDLICHGVPSHKLLDDYTEYLSDCYGGTVTDFSFRTKKIRNRYTPYTILFRVSGKEIAIPLRDSAYYRLYMSFAGYRASCYDCKFASADKPADITLGDYFIRESKSADIQKRNPDEAEYFSCIIVHSKTGGRYLDEAGIICHEIAGEDAVSDHANLQSASLPAPIGEKMLSIYTHGGFAGLQKYINRRNGIGNVVSLFRGRNE